MAREYPMWLHIKQVINTTTKDKKHLIIIGDSMSKAGFIPNEIKNFKSLNLSLGGATPLEGYYTLLKYLENNPAPENIILSYAAYHLLGYSLYWYRTVPYDFLNGEDYQAIEKKAKQFNLIVDNKSYIDYKNPFAYRSSFKNGIVEMRWKQNNKMLNECTTAQGHHYFGTKPFSKKLNKDTAQLLFKKSEFQDYYFRKLLTLAEKSHIKTHFFIMPYNKASYDTVNKEYIRNYIKYIKMLSKKYNMKMCNKLTYMANNNFGDRSHLFKGAKVNTRNMFNCIKQ